MALTFPHKTKKEIREQYNCFGLLAWCIPAYTIMHTHEETGYPVLPFGFYNAVFPPMEEANWVPRPLFYLGMLIASAWMGVTSAAGREAFPFWPLREIA